MSAHRQELMTNPQAFNFVPTTLKEATEYATIFANSGLCPESYKGRPNDILIVWQMGKEIGLDKMQALRTLGCINGMPFAYGDGLLALVKRHPMFEDMREWFEGTIEDKTLTAYCSMKRRGQELVTQNFSMNDAILAGLWNKKGVWQQYPKRMLQHRARGFASKDAFPDALYGLMTEHEVKDVVEPRNMTPEPSNNHNKGILGLKNALGLKSEPEIVEAEIIVSADNTDETVVAVEDTAIAVTSEIDDIPPDETPISKYDELMNLIRRYQIHGTKIKTYLSRCGAKSIKDLTEEQTEKWISHLSKKESQDAI